MKGFFEFLIDMNTVKENRTGVALRPEQSAHTTPALTPGRYHPYPYHKSNFTT
ncbi:hypothetical protein BDD43_1713 [Mucilaginibacter gracilis]|uniref:Uncharacterized protein n=1 Tax=Mucilaginibacter gracilis TaxID=423350 RepID=A0A495IZU7_9SPHI|nr:hypothetical protein [Mucilaginibacter gracilis]RKR81564.1 hypothetical protein BDD43_1713 [Mucilaginibacter gracilis]